MEDQHTEWKEIWRDEYMKELCAFANASGWGLLKYSNKPKGIFITMENHHG